MEGYPMDTLWDTMWIPYGVHCGDLGTLGGTRRTPGSSRETQERLKKRLKRDSRETVSTTPKTWIPKSEKSEMRTDTTHSSSKSSSNKRKSDTKGEGGK